MEDIKEVRGDVVVARQLETPTPSLVLDKDRLAGIAKGTRDISHIKG